jgi:hypothetical protein
MNIFKLRIPKSGQQTVTAVQSWVVEWKVADSGYKTKTRYKVFIDKPTAKLYEQELLAAGKLLGAWVETKIYPND